MDSIATVAEEAVRLSTSCGAFLSVERLRWLERDARWQVSYIVIHNAGRIISLLPLFAPLVDRWPDIPYDPRRTHWGGSAATEWVLVGGRADFAAGFLRDSNLPMRTALRAARLARDEVLKITSNSGRRAVALYVNPVELPFLRMALGPRSSCRSIDQEAILDVPRCEREYLATLKPSHRSVVRRDWRKLNLHGIRGAAVKWEEVLEPASEMIAAVARDHQRPDHQALVRLRLEGWLENSEISPIAFSTLINGRLIAVCLAWRWRRLLQLYAIGLAPRGAQHRHIAYVESMIYAPLRYAATANCVAICLAPGAIEPKRLRGARTAPLRALVADF